MNHVHGRAAGGVFVAIPEVEPSGGYVGHGAVDDMAGTFAQSVGFEVSDLSGAIPDFEPPGVGRRFKPLASN